MENTEDNLNELRIDNEIKKIKLSLEHGATFFSSSEQKMPPSLEAAWLNQIQQFEDSYAKNKRISIFDFTESPICKPVDEISDHEMESKLNVVLDLLAQKNIAIDTICEVDDRELYRFVTEELFLEEIDDMMIEGMVHHFTYEEFHPNHEYDIERYCVEFTEAVLNKKAKLNFYFLAMADEIHTKDGLVKPEEVTRKLESFRDLFSTLELQHAKIISLKIENDEANVSLEISYIGISTGEHMQNVFSAVWSFMLKYEYGYWHINKISIEGVV